MSVVLWGQEKYRKQLEEIQRGLKNLQTEYSFLTTDICICTGAFESFYGKEFAHAEILFAYFPSAEEEFCRFFISHRRYTEKTMFLFGQSYGCFDPEKMSNYYRMAKSDYLLITEPGDYFYETGLKALLCLIERRRSYYVGAQAG